MTARDCSIAPCRPFRRNETHAPPMRMDRFILFHVAGVSHRMQYCSGPPGGSGCPLVTAFDEEYVRTAPIYAKLHGFQYKYLCEACFVKLDEQNRMTWQKITTTAGASHAISDQPSDGESGSLVFNHNPTKHLLRRLGLIDRGCLCCTGQGVLRTRTSRRCLQPSRQRWRWKRGGTTARRRRRT